MLHSMPVQNTMHFIMPDTLDNWKSFPVAGVVGVMKKTADGSYAVIDAFDAETIPTATELAMDERFGVWTEAAGTRDDIRFDVFLTPKGDSQFRKDVVTLLERSCGFVASASPAYAHAV